MRALWALAIIATMSCAFNASAQPGDDRLATRLALVDRYLAVTHRDELMRTVYERELQDSMTFCRNQPCQADLDRAIREAAAESARTYNGKMRALFAQRLTAAQLRALVAFASSPEGRGVTAAQDAMSGELAQVGADMAKDSAKSISAHFCRSHPLVCIAPKR